MRQFHSVEVFVYKINGQYSLDWLKVGKIGFCKTQNIHSVIRMSIEIMSKRKKNFPTGDNVIVIDVTKNGSDPSYVRFSPFYSWDGGIPVPGFSNRTTLSVEGAWQGLKAFEKEGPDLSFLAKAKPTKRCVSESRGKVKGHRYGEGKDACLLGYIEARKLIYVPMYEHVLRTYLVHEVLLLKGLMDEGNRLIFLDYDTNEDIENPNKPLSHASVLKRWIEQLDGSNRLV